MKLSKLQNIAWVLFALILTSSTISAQGWSNRNRANYNQKGNCLYNISDLTEKQQTQIQEMEEKHLHGMDALRTKRRSTSNAIQKSELRTDMLKKVEAHQNSVKKVLTADQQKQYDQLCSYGNNGRNQQYGNGHGNNNFAGRGNGNGQFTRGNRGGTGYSNANLRSRGGNFQNGNGRGNGNRNYCQNNENNFRGRNANYGRSNGNRNFQQGKGRFSQNDSCVTHGSQNISDEGFEVIE